MRDDTSKLLANLGRPDFPYRDFGEEQDGHVHWPLVEAVLAILAPSANSARGDRYQAPSKSALKAQAAAASVIDSARADANITEPRLFDIYDAHRAEPDNKETPRVSDFLQNLLR
jgi:hypothetical protein